MKKFVNAGCLSLFILVMFSWPALSGDTLDTPLSIIQEREFDFGKVKEGNRVTHDFVIMNKGNDILEIKKVSPG